MPARNWDIDAADECPLPVRSVVPKKAERTRPELLEAILHPAAVIAVQNAGISLEHANSAFDAKFPAGLFDVEGNKVDGGFGLSERINELRTRGRPSIGFEIRREGPLGPEYFTCTLGWVTPAPDGHERVLMTVIDRTSERQTERNFRRELMSDSLTALPNRIGFGEEIEERVETLRDDGANGFAILAIDLVRFSRVNESLGPLVGDELIITVAKRLKSVLRQGDVLARIGGNEFAVFCRLRNGLLDALQVVDRINEVLSTPFRLSHFQISVDCAIGCALADQPTDDHDEIVRQAQAAMKIAKRSGKLEFYRPGVLREAHRSFTLESKLREALSNGNLTLSYQPLVHLRTNELTGFEALARWNDPDLGEVSPTEFIVVAEESGLIVPLGRWAMYEAAQALARWDRIHGAPLPVGLNVNLSAIQMARDDVASVLEEALRYAGIEGKRITVELTESAIVADPEKARHVLSAIKGLDASIAMDDFGTGFSNLASLQSLPIDMLKIDRSFVTGMLEDRDKNAIVRAILSLAESLELKVTAEGIENQALAAALADLGCWQGQGYYFAPALTDQNAFDYWRARWNFETI